MAWHGMAMAMAMATMATMAMATTATMAGEGMAQTMQPAGWRGVGRVDTRGDAGEPGRDA